MTKTTTPTPGSEGEALMQPSYRLFVKMPTTEARPFIRTLYKLIQHFTQANDVRGMTNKTGYRLQHQKSVCDFVYSYDSKHGGFQIQTQFKSGASNELAGRVLALLGLIISYHAAIGKPLQIDYERTNLRDMRTITKWGDWATKELSKKYPRQFAELAHLGPKAVKF